MEHKKSNKIEKQEDKLVFKHANGLIASIDHPDYDSDLGVCFAVVIRGTTSDLYYIFKKGPKFVFIFTESEFKKIKLFTQESAAGLATHYASLGVRNVFIYNVGEPSNPISYDR